MKQKKINNLGWLFLTIIVLYLVAMFSMNYAAQKGIAIPTILSILLSELIILLPSIVYMLINKLNIRRDLGFTKVKPGTLFLSLLLGFTIIPVASFFNILSQFFVPNTMVQASDALLSGPSAFLILMGGLLGPICEEFVFRGIFANEYNKYSTGIKAMLLSGLFFGLMHMNLNQLCYAFVLGVIFYILNKASGSTYTSIIAHIAINIPNLLTLVLLDLYMKNSGSDQNIAQSAEAARTSNSLVSIAITYFVLAIIFGAIGILLIRLIAKHEDRMTELKSLFSSQAKNKDNVQVPAESDSSVARTILNIPTIISIVGTFIVIILMDYGLL